MTNYLLLLQNEFKNDGRIAFLSHTVDPENDSVPVLKEYEQQNNIDGHQWHLLTGSRKELYDLSKNSYFLGVESDNPDNFEHSEKFVLVDTDKVIRGYYNGTDSLEVEKLKRDIKTLLTSNEK
jgi:protein SCO1/2